MARDTRKTADPAAARRLREARIAAGYSTAAAAARALGVNEETYRPYENGYNGFSHAAPDFARKFRVRLDWLVSGKGEMRGRADDGLLEIPIAGLVGAGAAVEQIGDPAGVETPDTFDVAVGPWLRALIVRGDSQLPRFRDGEVVLFDQRPVNPVDLLGHYAIVQTVDGRRLVKIIRRGTREGFWRLDSHNSEPEEDVRLIGAWRYLGVFSRDGGRA